MIINQIFGPPGTGKTTRLLEILEKELEEYSIDEIAFVSYTKEGSEQGKNRASEKLKIPLNDLPYFRTLHSLAFRECGLRRSNVIGKKDYKTFSKSMGMSFTGFYTEELKHNDDLYLFFDILYRNNRSSASRYLHLLDIEKLRFVREQYLRFRKHFQLLDYTDMIKMFVHNNKSVPVKVAIIDEAQDLTTLQWEMVWVAFRDCDKVYIAGDDDQAIYEWTGADVQYFLNIKGAPEILHRSYRLPNNVLNFSKNISSLIENRIEKEYAGTGEPGLVVFLNSFNEVELNDNETWMFISRNRCFLKDIEEWIRSQGKVYIHRKELSVKQSKIKAIKLYEKVRKTRLMDPREENKLKEHLNDKYSLLEPWYDSFNWDENEKTYYRDIVGNKTDIEKCNIQIDTIHSVKGGEADNVVLLLDITKTVNMNLHENPDSEHRVFYVGATRAKKNLWVVFSNSRYEYKVIGAY